LLSPSSSSRIPQKEEKEKRRKKQAKRMGRSPSPGLGNWTMQRTFKMAVAVVQQSCASAIGRRLMPPRNID
jgi:hypothetical protein